MQVSVHVVAEDAIGDSWRRDMMEIDKIIIDPAIIYKTTYS